MGIVLEEHDQAAHSAPRPPEWEMWAHEQAAGVSGGRLQAETQPGCFSTGAAGSPWPPETLRCQTALQPWFSGQPPPPPC